MADDIKLLNLLVIEDTRRDQEWIDGLVRGMGVDRVEIADSGEAAVSMLLTGQFNCAIVDEDLPEGRFKGIEILKDPRFDEVFKVILTVYAEDLDRALLYGARRFITKAELNRDADRLKLALQDAAMFVKSRLAIYYQSPAMSRFFRQVAAIARRDDPVLIIGQSGSGKELVAHAVHKISRRAGGPFEALNCACLDPTSAEADLFGVSDKGFTGVAARPGVFERAHQGTVFFDEIGELGLPEQKRLLRILEHPDELTRHGGHTRILARGQTVNFRCVFATDRDLTDDAAAQRFHRPLLERISRQVLQVPTLNERREDIPLLASVFMRHHSENVERLQTSAVETLRTADWTNRNVRGLWNAIARALVIAETREDSPSATVTGDDVRQALKMLDSPARFDANVLSERLAHARATLSEMEAAYISQVLRASSGKISDAAKVLGIGRNTLYDKVRRYHLDSLLAGRAGEQ